MSVIIRTAQSALVAGLVLTASFAPAFAVEPAQEESTFASVVSDEVLSESRGAFLPITLNATNLHADSSNNVVNGGTTGMNLIDNGSITNTQGLVNVIQNSGNNVIIQSSTTVNMTFNH